jgi:site-specific DNA-methyltransferase (adenine-specific)
MIFADPPYFLSNGGTTCKGGKRVSVAKGDWDKGGGVVVDHTFNLEWLSLCQEYLSHNGTIWVSGTHHNIFSVGQAMAQLGYKTLNVITWEKPNPPPNLACRYFTHSTEFIIWAAKNEKSKHVFNYKAMRIENFDKQMKTVWKIGAPGNDEKVEGKHPTQKPRALLRRIVLASTNEGDTVFDPFTGSGTTGVAAVALERNFIGCEKEKKYFQLATKRLKRELAILARG